MESETPPEGAAHRIADQHPLNGSRFADRTSSTDTDPQRSDPVTGDVSRKHWTVPVHGLTSTDPDGIVQAIARGDGTVSLHMTCGDTQTTG